jgi:hypothetical protein
MANPIKGRKLTLREIMDEIAADEEIGDKERERAEEISLELECQEWCSRLKKLNH